MDRALIQIVARELLGLTLTDVEASSLVEPLAGLAQLVHEIEKVPLPYPADPFIAPRSGDDSLETWPEQ